MLFRKKIERVCSYCLYGANLDEDQILCSKKGIRSPDDKCRKFKYDPLKRVPPKGLLEEELPVFEDETDEKGTKSL